MSIKSENEWNKMTQGLSLYNQVFIVDDIPINNPELIPYKEFYLKAYYYRFKE